MNSPKGMSFVFLALCFVVVITTLDRLLPWRISFVQQSAVIVGYPFVYSAHLLSSVFNPFYAHMKRLDEYKTDLNTLRHRYEKLLSDHVALSAYIVQDKKANELHSFKMKYTQANRCVAQIIARTYDTHEHTCWVDKGKRDGITKDMILVYKMQLLGRITQVYPWCSKAQLISDPACKVPCIVTASDAYGIAQGALQINQTNVCYIHSGLVVDCGQLVLTSGNGFIYPYGFSLGRITACCKQGAYYAITVTSLVEIKDITYCLIIKREDISST